MIPKNLRPLLPYLKRYRWGFVAGILCILLSNGAWVLLPGGQAATIAGPGKQWLLLPPTPAHTSVLASGPGTSLDALAVSGSTLTVWQLDHGSTVWARAQTINVPIQLGSSS